MTLRYGSKSGFLSSTMFCYCPKFFLPEPLLPAPPLFSDICCPLYFCTDISDQAGGGGCDTLTPLYPSMQLSKLHKDSHFHVFQRHGVAAVKEDLDSFVDLIHDARPKDTVSCEGLVVLMLEAINDTWLCRHRS